MNDKAYVLPYMDSFSVICNLMADWLRGDVSSCPGYPGTLASDAEEVSEPFIALNEAVS
jgi:hypothetical protein